MHLISEFMVGFTQGCQMSGVFIMGDERSTRRCISVNASFGHGEIVDKGWDYLPNAVRVLNVMTEDDYMEA